MGREANSGPATRHMPLILSSGAWRSSPVRIVTRRAARRWGLLPAPGPLGLLLRARSIHSFGMRTPLGWVAFDGAGTVLAAGVLRPGRIVWVRRAAFILEQPAHLGLPLPGTRVSLQAAG